MPNDSVMCIEALPTHVHQLDQALLGWTTIHAGAAGYVVVVVGLYGSFGAEINITTGAGRTVILTRASAAARPVAECAVGGLCNSDVAEIVEFDAQGYAYATVCYKLVPQELVT